MADEAGGEERAVVAALFGLLGGQIALGAVGQLDEEGLLGVGARLDLVAVVEEELERVGSAAASLKSTSPGFSAR